MHLLFFQDSPMNLYAIKIEKYQLENNMPFKILALATYIFLFQWSPSQYKLLYFPLNLSLAPTKGLRGQSSL